MNKLEATASMEKKINRGFIMPNIVNIIGKAISNKLNQYDSFKEAVFNFLSSVCCRFL